MEYYFKEEVKKDNHRHSTVSFLPLPPSFAAAAAAVPVTDSTATDKIHPLLAHYSAFMQKKDIGGGSASLLWAQVSNQADFIRATPYWVRFVKYVYDTIDSKVWMIVLVTCIVILTYPFIVGSSAVGINTKKRQHEKVGGPSPCFSVWRHLV